MVVVVVVVAAMTEKENGDKIIEEAETSTNQPALHSEEAGGQMEPFSWK